MCGLLLCSVHFVDVESCFLLSLAEIVPLNQKITQESWKESVTRQLTLTFGVHNRIWTDLIEQVPKLTHFLDVQYPDTWIAHGNLVAASLVRRICERGWRLSHLFVVFWLSF